MIITRINCLATYVGVNQHFEKLIAFLKSTDLDDLQEGSLEIDGDSIFGNCFTYLADGEAGTFFETHQKYLDIHLVLENEEAMAVTSPESVSVTQEYDENKDIALYKGKVEQLGAASTPTRRRTASSTSSSWCCCPSPSCVSRRARKGSDPP